MTDCVLLCSVFFLLYNVSVMQNGAKVSLALGPRKNCTRCCFSELVSLSTYAELFLFELLEQVVCQYSFCYGTKHVARYFVLTKLLYCPIHLFECIHDDKFFSANVFSTKCRFRVAVLHRSETKKLHFTTPVYTNTATQKWQEIQALSN